LWFWGESRSAGVYPMCRELEKVLVLKLTSVFFFLFGFRFAASGGLLPRGNFPEVGSVELWPPSE